MKVIVKIINYPASMIYWEAIIMDKSHEHRIGSQSPGGLSVFSDIEPPPIGVFIFYQTEGEPFQGTARAVFEGTDTNNVKDGSTIVYDYASSAFSIQSPSNMTSFLIGGGLVVAAVVAMVMGKKKKK